MSNPYASPNVEEVLPVVLLDTKGKALRSLRISLVLLLIPAAYNFGSYSMSLSPKVHGDFLKLLTYGGLVGIALAITAIWLLGLPLLELITYVLHAIFGRRSSLAQWKQELYLTVRRLPWFAIPGAMIWSAWTFAFYQVGLDFMAISLPAAVAAHIIGALVYFPLLYRWYVLEKLAAQSSSLA